MTTGDAICPWCGKAIHAKESYAHVNKTCPKRVKR